MTFTIPRKETLDQIKRILPLIPKNPIIPCLSDLRILVAENIMNITATNLECFATVQVPVVQDDPTDNCTILVDAATLAKLLANADSFQTITVETDEFQTISLQLPAGKYEFSLSSTPEEYPNIPTPDEEDCYYHCRPLKWAQMMGKVAYCCSKDDLRPAMTAVYQNIGPAGAAEFVATDGTQLAKAWCNDFAIEPDESSVSNNLEGQEHILWPADAVKYLHKFLTDDPIRVWLSDTHIHIDQGAANFAFVKMDAKFPDYNAVIRTHHDQTLFVPSSALKDVLSRTGVIANKVMQQAEIRLSKRDKFITITAKDWDNGKSGTEMVFLHDDIVSKSLAIGVSILRLNAVLDHIATEPFIRFHFGTAAQAILLMPYQSNGENSADETPEELHLLMPLTLSEVDKSTPDIQAIASTIAADLKEDGITLTVTTDTSNE